MFVFAAGYEGTITNLQIVLNIPKTLLKSYYPKKYLPNIPSPPKNPGIKNFKPQKSFDHPGHFKSGAPPPRPGPGVPVI